MTHARLHIFRLSYDPAIYNCFLCFDRPLQSAIKTVLTACHSTPIDGPRYFAKCTAPPGPRILSLPDDHIHKYTPSGTPVSKRMMRLWTKWYSKIVPTSGPGFVGMHVHQWTVIGHSQRFRRRGNVKYCYRPATNSNPNRDDKRYHNVRTTVLDQ